MYPVPSEASLDVNLDLTHLKLLEFEVIPDILILPSNLAKFAKVRDNSKKRSSISLSLSLSFFFF